MKVLVVSHLFPSTLNEAHGVWLYRLLRACRALGVDARVIHPAPVPGRATDPGVWLRPIPEAFGRFTTRAAVGDDVPSLHPSHGPNLFLPGFMKHLPRRLATEVAFHRGFSDGFRPDVVHAVTSYHSGTSAAPIAQRLGVPLVVSEISGPYTLETRPAFRRKRAHRVLSAARQIACTSEYMKETVAREFPEFRDKLDVVYFPVDERLFTISLERPPPVPFRLLSLGSLVAGKGWTVLLQSLALLERQGPKVEWTIVGDGPLRRSLEEQARKLAVAHRVHFAGFVRPDALAPHFEKAHAFVLPSLGETQSLALIEGLAAGLPAVYTRCGAPEEYMDESLGIGVPVNDAQALAHAVTALFNDYARFDRIHIRATCRARFSGESQARAMIALWERALGQTLRRG